MESFHKTLSTSAGDILIYYTIYPNSSVFVWVSAANEVELNDLHIAVPDKFGRLPALSTRLGDSESRGRFVALRLSKKLGTEVVVSWSLSGMGEADSLIESEILKDICAKRDTLHSLLGRNSPSVGA